MDSLHFTKTYFIPAPVIQLGRLGRGMISHGCRDLNRAPIFEIRRNPCGSKGMVADLSLDPRSLGPPAYHGMRIGLMQRRVAELISPPLYSSEKRPFRVTSNTGLIQIGVQVLL